jgi:hypothetical protein
MLTGVAVLAIFLSVLLYVAVSLFDARGVTTSQGFFQNAGGPLRAIISLTAFSITLGTGVTYVLAQAADTGWLIFLTPFGVVAGYFAIAIYYSRLGYKADAAAPNIGFLLGPKGPDGQYQLTGFARLFGLFMALTYLLLLAYESGIGSRVIVDSLLGQPTKLAYVGFAILIYGTVAFYTGLAGLRAAVSTDVWQIVFVLTFAIALAVLLFGGQGPTALQRPAIAGQSQLAVSTALLALILAVSTQFYSIVNAHVGTIYEPNVQAKIFTWVGILSGCFYAAIAMIGLMVGAPEDLAQRIREFLRNGQEGVAGGILVFLCFSGMLAILMSTLDNMSVSVTKLIYEDLFKLNPFKKDDRTKSHLLTLRISHAFVSLTVVAAMSIFVIFFPNAFQLLLTILFAATVMSPLSSVAIWIHSRGGRSLLSQPVTAWLLFAAAILAWGAYFALTVMNLRQEGVWLHIAAFGVACLIAAYDLWRWRRAR